MRNDFVFQGGVLDRNKRSFDQVHQDDMRLENLEQGGGGRSTGGHSKRARRKKPSASKADLGLQQQSFAYLASSSSAMSPDGCVDLNVTDVVAGRVCNPGLVELNTETVELNSEALE
jgi:hypothetical protein